MKKSNKKVFNTLMCFFAYSLISDFNAWRAKETNQTLFRPMSVHAFLRLQLADCRFVLSLFCLNLKDVNS
jgi:hypothetical protein